MEKRSEKLKLDPITGELTIRRLPMKNYDNVTHNGMNAAGFFGGNFAAPAEKDKLLIFPTLTKLPTASSCDNFVNSKVAREGFFGGSFVAPPDKHNIVTTPQSYGKEEVSVETMHISCKSDTYKPTYNYGGVIIYHYNGKSEWRTANNTHCKSGYIVIQDTDSENVKKWIGKEPGAVHGAVYRNAFGESVNDAEVVGEGFAIRNDKLVEINSSVFNNPQGSVFHDHRRRMHELSEECIKKVVEYWKTAGPCWLRQSNFEVKHLLKDFDFDSL
jgi:hypothetical protein